MRFFSSVVCVLAVLASLAAPAFAQPADLILVHPGARNSLYDISAIEFAKRVNKRLPESHRVLVAQEPELGDGERLLQSVKSGGASFALASSAMLKISQRFAVFELPYLIRSRAQVGAIRARLLEPFLEPAANARGWRILGLWENGFRHITNDLEAAAKPDALRGIRIGVVDNKWREKTVAAFGARPVPIDPGALPDAVHQQSVDGQEAPLTDIASQQYNNVQRHLTLTDHLYSPAFLIAHGERFDKLPAAVRSAIREEAAKLEGWVQKAAIAIESDLVDRLDKRMELTHAEVRAFERAGRRIYAEFVGTVPEGMKMIEAIQSVDDKTAANRASN